MTKVLVSCSLNWVAFQIVDDFLETPTHKIKFFTSLRKKKIHDKKIKSIVINLLGMLPLLRYSLVKLTNSNYIFFPIFDIICSIYILIYRPKIFFGYSGMSRFSLATASICKSTTFMYCGNSHFTKHYPISEENNTITKIYSRLFYKKRLVKEYSTTNFIIVESSYSRKSYIENNIDASKILLVPTRVDKIFYHNQQKTVSDIYRFISIGLQKRKGIIDLIQAWKMSGLSEKEDAELILIGKLPSEIQKYELPKNILHYQNRTQNEIKNLLSKCQVFCCLTYEDGGPRSLIEAYLSNCIIVSTTNSIAPDLPKGKYVIYNKPGEIKFYAKVLMNLYLQKSIVIESPQYNEVKFDKLKTL